MELRWLCRIFLLAHFAWTSNGTSNHIADSIKSPKNSTDQLIAKSNISHTNDGQPEKEEFVDKVSNQSHSRKKRFIWVTDDGRLALPPGTVLTMTPTLAMPLVRHPPDGFLSNITISLPVSMDFDKLGLTDEENPVGVLPPVFAKSFGRAAGTMLGNYIASYMHYRMKRETAQPSRSQEESSYFKMKAEPEEVVEPILPADFKHAFHGGERALLYGMVEDFIATFGFNGKACLLRTICEVHNLPLARFGVFGEVVKLFLTASKSPFADHISDYVRAQEIGEGKMPPGECFPYYKDCPRGLFKVYQKHKYSEEAGNHDVSNNENEAVVDQSYNEIKDEIFDKKLLKGRILTGTDSM